MAETQIKITAENSGALRGIQQVQKALGGIQNAASSAQTALAGIVGGLATGGLFNFIDGLQNMQNKLLVVSGSQEEFARATQAVRDVSDKTGQSLQATGDLYSKVATNAERLGFNQDQVVTITNSFATALKIGGASAQSAGAAMYQFGQILNKNKIEGDDFNTIMEAVGGKTMTTLAESLGITTAQLREFASKGLLNGQDLARGFINILGKLDGQAANTSQTLGQSLQRIQNAFGEAALAIDKSTGFSEKFAAVAKKLADNGANLVPVLKAIGAALLVSYFWLCFSYLIQ
jgi:tape measure domain-containing protein